MENRGPLIKDIFNKELIEVCKYLYVRMQGDDTKAKAIKAWDNLEILMYSSIDDKVRLEKTVRVLDTISSNDLLDISLNKEKVKRYLPDYYNNIK